MVRIGGLAVEERGVAEGDVHHGKDLVHGRRSTVVTVADAARRRRDVGGSMFSSVCRRSAWWRPESSGVRQLEGQSLSVQHGNEMVQDIAPDQHSGPIGCHAANSRDVESFDDHPHVIESPLCVRPVVPARPNASLRGILSWATNRSGMTVRSAPVSSLPRRTSLLVPPKGCTTITSATGAGGVKVRS